MRWMGCGHFGPWVGGWRWAVVGPAILGRCGDGGGKLLALLLDLMTSWDLESVRLVVVVDLLS